MGSIDITALDFKGEMGSVREVFPVPGGNMLVLYVNPYIQNTPVQVDSIKMTTVSLISKSGRFVKKDFVQLPTPYPSEQTLAYFGSGMYVFSGLSFYPDIRIDADNEGNIFIGKSDSHSIKEYDENGTPGGGISEDYQPAPLSESHMDSLYREYGNIFQKAASEAGHPDYWPTLKISL